MQGALEALREVGTELAQRERLAAQSRDHHLLRVPALERQFAGEHLERDDAERVDIGARVELLATNLLGAHELRRAEDDAVGRALGDLWVRAPLLSEP